MAKYNDLIIIYFTQNSTEINSLSWHLFLSLTTLMPVLRGKEGKGLVYLGWGGFVVFGSE